MENRVTTVITVPEAVHDSHIILHSQRQIEDMLNNFIVTQDVKESSRRLYLRTLRLYINWAFRKGYRLGDITRREVLEYKEELLQSGLSSLTVGSYITAVRKFYEWAEANRLYPNVAKGVKTPTRKQQFRKQPLTAEQSKQLLDYYKGNLRDYAIINLLLRTGLRTIEVVRANIGDITFKGGRRILRVWGKGRDERDSFVILTDKAYRPIQAYIRTRGNVNPDEPLFTSTSNNSNGKRLSTRTISQIAKQGLKAIGLDSKDYTAHSLRHTTAVSILRSGGRIEDAQGVLRHSNPSTTQIYTATIQEEMRLKTAAEELIDRVY